MKLLIVQPFLNIKGGYARVILKIAQHYDATIYTLEYEKDKTFDEFKSINIKTISKHVPFSEMLPYRASQGLRYGYAFYNMKLEDDFDLINAHISPSEFIRHKNSPVLWYCHTPPREVYDMYSIRMKGRSYKDKIVYASFVSVYKFLAKGIVSNIEEIATNSNNTKSRIKKYFMRDSTVISPGVDYELFSNKNDEKYFLYPSRITPTKRQEYAIKAFQRFLKMSGDKHYKLILAGELSSDPEHRQYFQKLSKMASKNVVFKIDVTDKELIDLYAHATAVLFTSINEDFGIVPLEAMASSKPIISVNEGGPKETVVNNETGFLVNSPEEMAQKMLLVSENKALAEKLGRNGRQRVVKNYSWDVFLSKFDRLARKTIKESSER
ncbi:MAG: glycosyltransferase [Candidatus Micrarchaeia archaeon]